jgi:hypothetical protein
MPRFRLGLRAYATVHGQIVIGPYADPNQVEAEAWAEIRRQCAHLNRALLRPERNLYPFGGMTLKVISTEKMLPVAVVNIHSLLVQLDDGEAE